MTPLLAILLALTGAVADNVQSVLDCAQQAGASLATFTADLRQTRSFRYFPGEDEITIGTLVYKKPLMVLKLTEPVPKTLWVGPDLVEIYTPSTGQLERWERGTADRKAPSPLSLTVDGEALEAEYVVTLVRANDKTSTLRLEPRPGTEAAKSFSSRTMTFRTADCIPVRYEFTEVSGDKTVIELSNVAVNPEVPNRDLKKTYPKDVEVIPLNDIGLH